MAKEANEDVLDRIEGEPPPEGEPEPDKVKPPEPDELTKTKGELDNLKKALGEERSKRQEAQRMLEYHQFQMKIQASQPPKREEPNPDIEALKPLVQPILDEAMGPMTQEMRKTKAELSEERARGRYKDYDQVIADFLPVMQQDPTLMQMFYASPDPGEFAYRMAMFTNWDKYVQKAKEEGRQEILKKFEKGEKPPVNLSTQQSGRPPGEGEITVEQAAKLSPQAWATLPEKTRRRLLGA